MTDSERHIMKEEVREGLLAPQKRLPCKYFYDAHGSYLFEQICLQPEYYQTRTELSILEMAAPVVITDLKPDILIEFGPGNIQKVKVLLNALRHVKKGARYIPVDVCQPVLESAARDVTALYPDMTVLPVIADFTASCEIPPAEGQKLIIFLGSTIGNLGDAEALAFLLRVSRLMGPEDSFLLGADMLKPKDVLEAAYNDRCGITAEFNCNILRNVNRQLGAHFDLSFFDHVAFYNDDRRQIEMHLKANRDMEVMIDALGLTITLARDETIFTELCRKYSRADIEMLAGSAGLTITRWFNDPKEWFSLVELALPDHRER